MVRLAQIAHLSCTDTNTIPEPTKTRFHMPRHLVVPSGVYKMISEPLIHSAQTMHLSCVKIRSISKWTESSFYLASSPWSTIRCVQSDLWEYGTFAQVVHLSCVKISTISKRTESNFQLSLISIESIRCVQYDFWAKGTSGAKSCIYLAPTLTLSLNWSKWDSTWPTSPRSSIGYFQNDFGACGTFGANCAPILHQD
jgi:hypothetical protein